jgi:hypothetical protein
MSSLRIETKGVITHIYVDEGELHCIDYELSQSVGEIPRLTVTMYADNIGLDIDYADMSVIEVEKEK